MTLEDCTVVGLVVQWTAQGIFAAQQLIEFVEERERDAIRPWKDSPRDGDILNLLEDYLPNLELEEEDATSLVKAISKVRTIESIRHHLAHLALRRHPQVDALIGLSLRRRENFRKVSLQPRYGEVMTVYISMPEVREMLDGMQEAVNYMTSLYSRIAGKP
ncbi:hypothetical protein K3152_03455 [Qipengyuania sp. 1NDH17]|uniref:Uncharacterized protein n=1 Tax=Qipengyuania polymorpha TaxID=2867234 RepID=A0ABS7IV29_9SPHN|nr:hypothetical protein [Qipengyuania polymorpha]MBX7457293.1 hypothetical protein [Qipengyuania polymorpha]